MDDLDLLIDLHQDGARQGPGGDAETCLSITLSGLKGKPHLTIADIGCGTGASTFVLARELNATITAVDLFPQFLDRLKATARERGLDHKIETVTASMDALPFEESRFDAIWSEGAVYNMGFENGIAAWRRFLKPGGVLAVSELIWLTQDRPQDVEEYWTNEYPDVAMASEKMAILEANGYSPIGFFPLAETCWLNNYYDPLQKRFVDFLSRNGDTAKARELIRAEKTEIAVYRRFSTIYSYGYFVARKTEI